MPAMTSRAKVWAPKPTAIPTIPARASSGAICTPIADSAIKTATKRTTTNRIFRKTGRRVRILARLRASSVFGRPRSPTSASLRSITDLMACHGTSAIRRMTIAVSTPSARRANHAPCSWRWVRSIPQPQASMATAPMINSARIQRSMHTSTTVGAPLSAGVKPVGRSTFSTDRRVMPIASGRLMMTRMSQKVAASPFRGSLQSDR